MIRLAVSMLLAGWLANALAAPDRDVRAGIEAYRNKQWDEALQAFVRAEERLGERPEIHFDKGLVHLAKEDVESARTAFEHGTESERSDVRASSFYELGNIAFDAQEWETAIGHYVDALKARPEHAAAKWNLELALQRKKEEEEKQEKDEQEKDEQEKDEQEKDEQEQDEQKQDEQKQDEQKQDEQKQDEQKQDEQKQDEQKQDEQKQDEQKQDEQKQDEQKQDEQEPAAQPRALDKADIERALQQLDEQDEFRLGRPVGPPPGVDKDW